MQTQKLAPEFLRPVEQVRTDPEDVRENEVLGRAFSQRLRRMPVVRVEESLVLFRVDVPDNTVAQLGEKVRQAQADLAALADIVPWQRVQVGSAQLQDQCFRGSVLASVPGGAVAFLVFRSECDGILEWQHLEAAFPKAVKDALVQQEIVRVAGNPEAGQVGGKLPQDAIDPGAHDASAFSSPTRSIRTALRSGA